MALNRKDASLLNKQGKAITADIETVKAAERSLRILFRRLDRWQDPTRSEQLGAGEIYPNALERAVQNLGYALSCIGCARLDLKDLAKGKY